MTVETKAYKVTITSCGASKASQGRGQEAMALLSALGEALATARDIKRQLDEKSIRVPDFNGLLDYNHSIWADAYRVDGNHGISEMYRLLMYGKVAIDAGVNT